MIDDDLSNSRTTDRAFATIAVVPLLGDELSMPAKNCVRREQRAEVTEQFSAEYLTLQRQSTPLIIVEQESSLAELLLEDSILSHQILDDFLLLAVDPVRKHDETEFPGLKNRCHDRATG